MSELAHNDNFEIDYFRMSVAATQFIYFLSLIPRINDFFGANGWVSPFYRGSAFSLLKISDLQAWRWVLLIFALVFLVLLFKGSLNKFFFFMFYIINLSFYIWNPYIQHEAQPIMNLFFISMFFLPIKKNEKYDPFIKNALIIVLGIYYFIAGIKKIPDKHFIDSTAIEGILSWNVMAKNLNFNLFLVKYLRWPIRAMNYLTLFFEMSFIFAIFTRLRVYYIIFGLFFHILIFLTLDVGNLSFVMFCWYVLLFDSHTRSDIKQISQNLGLNY